MKLRRIVGCLRQTAFTFYSNQWYVVVSPHATPGNTQWFVQNSMHPSPYIHLEATGQAETHLSNENAEVLEQLMHELHVHHNMQVCCIGITLNVKLHFFLNYKVHFA